MAKKRKHRCLNCKKFKIAYYKTLCANCYQKNKRLQNPLSAAKYRKYHNFYYHQHKEKIRERERLRNQKRRKNPEYKRQSRSALLKRKYGITINDYELIWNKQNGACNICLKAVPLNANTHLKRLHVDHCHQTGRVRGLLCCHCNWYLAKIDKDFGVLTRIIDHLITSYKKPAKSTT